MAAGSYSASMSAADLLEHPEVRAQVSPISVEQYHQFPEFNQNGRRTELIRGIVLEKMPKTPLHASIGKVLYDALMPIVPEGYSVRQDQPLTLRESEPEPDVAVVEGTVSDYWESHPTTAVFVIEVAVTSLSLDREKAALYAEAGVEEYWIVRPLDRKIHVYRQPMNDAYLETSTTEGAVTCKAIPGFVVDMAGLVGRRK
jgi:Uma2 family endonuclease